MRWCTFLAAAACVSGCTSSDSSAAPKAEVAETEIKLDLPAPPDFPDPKPYADGSHSVTEMRLKGQKFLEQNVKITGFVVYKYDLDECAAEEGDKKVKQDPKVCEGKKDIAACTKEIGKKIVADSPNVCDRPYFYLADTANASFEKSLWVVDVPRPLRDDEKRDPSRVEEFKKGPPPPQIGVGQKVTVDGQWSLKSRTGFGNSDGLLVYAGLQPAP
jgi:hypothetical protein